MDELKRLTEENKKLIDENTKLKQLLKQYGYQYIDDELILNTEQRLTLFMDYFKGRIDVYPYKYFNKKKNKYTFSAFKCLNYYKNDFCLVKQGKKCSSECLLYKPKPLTKAIVYDHLSKDHCTIGIYPILDDNTCYFLAIDFDDDLWFDNMLSVYRVARKNGLSCIMERSQSGNGGHLWFFFETAIKAKKARVLGDYLLKEAMNTNKNLSFSSFDRMFPNQDYLSGEGFGNFIALPLHRDATKKGNSYFINEFGEVINKQYHYLHSTAKIKEVQIDQLTKFEDASLEKFIDQEEVLLLDQISQPLTLREDSMIHISKKGLNAHTIKTLRKLASTKNPEYHLKLKLHFSVYNIPRTLSEYIEDDYTISIPRGLKSRLLQHVPQELITYESSVENGTEIDVTFKGEMRSNQQEAVDELLKQDVAMMVALPGFGKTVAALSILATLKTSTLIIVHTRSLLDQWKERIDKFINYPQSKLKRDHYIGEYHGGKKKLKYQIDVALIQSLANLDDFSVLDHYGLVLIDESHHASSDSYRAVLRHIKAKRIYSFSASYKRKDQLEKVTSMYLGDIAYKSNKQEILEARTYEQILIPRITTFTNFDSDKSFTEICSELYKNQKRNYLIIQDVIKEIKENKSIIILTDRKEHISILYNQIKHQDYPVFYMDGNTPSKERHQIIEALHTNNHYVLIATSQLLGEGFDLPSLNTMFITMPISFEGRLIQYVGRLHRDYQDKTMVKVYDYVDSNVRMLENMFKKRLRTYKSEGYKAIEDSQVVQMSQVIFDKSNYEYALQKRINEAKKNVIIFASECKINRIQRLQNFLLNMIAKGTKVYICINKKYDNPIIDYLKGCCTKIVNIDSSINGILIDETELWTGSCSYLGIQNNDLYYLKTDDINLIEELKSKIS